MGWGLLAGAGKGLGDVAGTYGKYTSDKRAAKKAEEERRYKEGLLSRKEAKIDAAAANEVIGVDENNNPVTQGDIDSGKFKGQLFRKSSVPGKVGAGSQGTGGMAGAEQGKTTDMVRANEQTFKILGIPEKDRDRSVTGWHEGEPPTKQQIAEINKFRTAKGVGYKPVHVVPKKKVVNLGFDKKGYMLLTDEEEKKLTDLPALNLSAAPKLGQGAPADSGIGEGIVADSKVVENMSIGDAAKATTAGAARRAADEKKYQFFKKFWGGPGIAGRLWRDSKTLAGYVKQDFKEGVREYNSIQKGLLK